MEPTQGLPADQREKLDNHPALQAPKRTKPLFSAGTGEGEATVIFVLGCPGSGKGTQSFNLVRDYGFRHLSAGDLLREEQNRPESEFGEMIKNDIKEGRIVPSEVTIQLLENAMNATIEKDGGRRFLVDGFPRTLDQGIAFENVVVPSAYTLFFDCPLDLAWDRIMNRGKTSGRADDNAESLKKRFKTFENQSMPAVDHYEAEGKVIRVNASKEPDEVYQEVQEAFAKRGIHLDQ